MGVRGGGAWETRGIYLMGQQLIQSRLQLLAEVSMNLCVCVPVCVCVCLKEQADGQISRRKEGLEPVRSWKQPSSL